MTTLVGRNRNALHVFLNRSVYYFFDRTIMPQMNHFCAAGLQNTPHDIDGRVMAVKQTGCRDEPDMMLRFVNFNCSHIEKHPFFP